LLVSWRRFVAVPRVAVAAEPGAAAAEVPQGEAVGAVPPAEAAAAVPAVLTAAAAVLTAAAAVRLVAVDSPHLRTNAEQSIMQRLEANFSFL
jgi:hypothetical protein